MTNTNPDAELLKAKQVAQLLSISLPHLYNLQKKGLIPPSLKLGSSARWSKSELMKWISDGCPELNSFDSSDCDNTSESEKTSP